VADPGCAKGGGGADHGERVEHEPKQGSSRGTAPGGAP